MSTTCNVKYHFQETIIIHNQCSQRSVSSRHAWITVTLCTCAGMPSVSFNELRWVPLVRVICSNGESLTTSVRLWSNFTGCLNLPIRQRTTFKVATLTHKLCNSNQPHFFVKLAFLSAWVQLAILWSQTIDCHSNGNSHSDLWLQTIAVSVCNMLHQFATWNSKFGHFYVLFIRQPKTFIWQTCIIPICIATPRAVTPPFY